MPGSELDLKALGDALVSLRTQRGMTRTDLAEASGLSYPYVAELEKGRKNPSARALAQLASALDVPPLELQAFAEGRASVESLLLPQLVRHFPGAGSMSSLATWAPAAPGSEGNGELAAQISAAVMSELSQVIEQAIARALREAGIE